MAWSIGWDCYAVNAMRTIVYVETSVPSFYHEVRAEPEMVAELVTSAAVIDELERGEYPSRRQCLDLLGGLPLLAIELAVIDIVDAYIARQVMPANPAGDALHLALASFHRCDFLVTWNCRHLANATKFGHIRRVNTLLGLFVPTLVTLLELLQGENR